ncbi:hypothetical protein MHO82_10595 [Vibrio sp. Of7-15]|uniref:hypothetical protein n=1 Tax=Vibrio sp. Of7-15 TaxID=2724879 RepID=UPI001EF1D672|nr:hypothetical protein [Vibrio sp. Of7-15]MCG7497316.1 hypothetical protein [Vibrio sp. Of7-15]
MVDVDLKKIPTDIKVKSNIQSYTDFYLLVDFTFYNPSTMSRGYTWQVNFGDTEINREYVDRSLGFEGTYNYFDCKNEIEETTFKEYQKYWVNLVEIINNNEVNYTNR